MFGCFWCQSKDDFYRDSKKCFSYDFYSRDLRISLSYLDFYFIIVLSGNIYPLLKIA